MREHTRSENLSHFEYRRESRENEEEDSSGSGRDGNVGEVRVRREDTTVNMEDRMKETRQDVLEAHFTQSSSE